MNKFLLAARKALATFLFAGIGVVLGVPVLDIDADAWKLVLSVGAGATLNLVYRWAEKART